MGHCFMKQLPPALQAHLTTGTTTLAWCWRVTRGDGTAGFADHDRDLAFDGTTFEAATGFTASEIKDLLGLSVDNLEVSSALKSDRLNEDARRHLVEIPRFEARPGDVLVFRWRRGSFAKHCAILSALPLPACGERVGVRGSHTGPPIGTATMIHALEGAPVSEVALSPWWRRHLAAAFAFPAVSDPPGPKRMANGEWRMEFKASRPFPIRHSLFAIRHSLTWATAAARCARRPARP